MRRTLAARLSRGLVGCYPRRWRQRYGGELLDVLDQHRPGVRTVLDLGAGALGAHLDPAYRMEGLAVAGRHKNVLAAGIAAVMVLVLLAGGWWIAAWWQEEHGSPLPLSEGTWGVAFSPDGRIVATVNPGLELWDVADPAHPKRLAYSHGPLVMPGEPAFSPNGRVLATNGGGSGVLWNVTDPARLTEIAILPGRNVGQGAMVFSPAGASWRPPTTARWSCGTSPTRPVPRASPPTAARPAAFPPCRSPRTGTCWPAAATTAR
jgi:hypothetical protein